MSYFVNSKRVLYSLALLSSVAFASNENSPYFTVSGSTPAVIKIKPGQQNFTIGASSETLAGIKTIQLMSIVPSERMIANNVQQRQKIGDSAEPDYSAGITPFDQSPGAVDLGMSNVPVLDQGQYGTCVTFSSTAALDARFSLGDYIDQQCSLALDAGLGTNYWNGANAPSDIFNPLIANGFVQKGQCFGDVYANTSQTVDAVTYQTISNKQYDSQISSTYSQSPDVNAVKAALKAGNRVLIGTFLADNGDPISVNGFDITVGGVPGSGGLWACQQSSSSSNYCPPQSQLSAGHEIVIIGYDDNQQLLKIRNSWSTAVGDQGNYYMTYTFFSSMVMDYTVVN